MHNSRQTIQAKIGNEQSINRILWARAKISDPNSTILDFSCELSYVKYTQKILITALDTELSVKIFESSSSRGAVHSYFSNASKGFLNC